ncbi:MAG: penicillin-binding transpeptidase domain-containing protein, partial [Anaerolineaceae bacterium]
VLSVANGFWVTVYADRLLNRSDNLRSSISDLFVERGSFLDRNNTPITQTVGQRGAFSVKLLYPSLSPVIGYSDLYYGQAGLQASLDPYLRGLQANAASEIWSHALLYSQRPPGLNVRLSLDMDLQRIADSLLEGTKGAVVLLNAQSGEILALSTSPYFDSNTLADNYAQWTVDTNAPFFNRALQGQYKPETALAPFFLYQALLKGSMPSIPDQLSYPIRDGVITCAEAPQSGITWGSVVANGCPGAAAALVDNFTPADLNALYEQFGFYEAPTLTIPVSSAERKNPEDLLVFFSTDADGIAVSPLQMARAAAALTSNGIIPDPTLVLGVKTPHQGWVILNAGIP